LAWQVCEECGACVPQTFDTGVNTASNQHLYLQDEVQYTDDGLATNLKIRNSDFSILLEPGKQYDIIVHFVNIDGIYDEEGSHGVIEISESCAPTSAPTKYPTSPQTQSCV
jgi:hypothetical protein